MRLLRDLVTGVLTIAISVSVIGASPALAKANCAQTAPQADVTLTQSLSFANGIYTVTATLVNLGPCNVPDVSLQLNLPAGSTAGAFSSNPSSWSCVTTANPVTCAPQATMGVPGTAVINVSFTTAATNPTVVGQAIVGGGATWCVTKAAGPTTSTCDPNTDNNLGWAAFVPAGGGSVSTCTLLGCGDQYTNVSVQGNGSGGGVQVQQLKQACPPGFPNCFGKLVSISSPISGSWTKTFTINASLATVSFGKVVLINNIGNGWTAVPLCGTTAPDPCVLSKTKFKTANGTLFYQFVVLTTHDDSWGFD